MLSYFTLFISSLLFTMLVGPLIIMYLKTFNFNQHIRKTGPTSHLNKKGVPTIGGLIFLLPILAYTLFVADLNESIRFIIFTMFGFALICLVDDLIKIKCKRNLGLTIKEKISLQILITTLIYIIFHKQLDTTINLATNLSVDLGHLYFLFFILLNIATVNATNLTDGLDGLLAGVVLTALVPFTILSYSLQKDQLLLFILICMGSILGFLFFNKNPAKVFMGDTGSFALGGLLAGLSVITKTELLLILVGGVLVLEALSVVIQLVSLKFRKKRVFKMAPIHHTFELMDWHETKVVKMFWLLSTVLSGLSVMLII